MYILSRINIGLQRATLKLYVEAGFVFMARYSSQTMAGRGEQTVNCKKKKVSVAITLRSNKRLTRVGTTAVKLKSAIRQLQKKSLRIGT